MAGVQRRGRVPLHVPNIALWLAPTIAFQDVLAADQIQIGLHSVPLVAHGDYAT